MIVAVGIFIYSQVGSGTSEAGAIAPPGETTTLKCSSCGHTLERETAELQRLSPSPFPGHIALSSEMAKCPKCGRLDLQVVPKAQP